MGIALRSTLRMEGFVRMKCALCKETLNPDAPDVVYAHNPETFRLAWMHGFCFQHTYMELKNEQAKETMYSNRQDEYDSKFQ